MRYVLWVMMLAAACGGSESAPVLTDADCNACLGGTEAQYFVVNANGGVTCNCAIGSGSQTYGPSQRGTAQCASDSQTWGTYSTGHCH